MLETSREDGSQPKAFISFFMSSVDQRRQTPRFIVDLILPRSHREFGLIDGLLRAKSEREERKMNRRWAEYFESTPVSSAGRIRDLKSYFPPSQCKTILPKFGET